MQNEFRGGSAEVWRLPETPIVERGAVPYQEVRDEDRL